MIACTAIRIKNADYQPHYEYDTATYDLFPFFKFDFRPFAQTLDDWAEPDPFFCNEDTVRKEQAGAAPLNLIPAPPRPNIIAKWTWRGLAAILRNFPFMETNVVHTRTIGNLDPMRAPFGELFGDANDPATWYGTTHELLTNFKTRAGSGQNPYATILAQYADAASAEKSECAVVDGWLWTARSRGELTSTRGRVNWDSGYSIERNGKIVPPSDNDFNVTKIRPRPDDPTRHIESQVRQTLFFSGMRNIAGANDPFWNVRAFQSAMTNHNGYVSYPLICSIFQFVMDDITKENVAADLPR